MKLSRNRVALAVAVIGAIAVIAGALITAFLGSGSGGVTINQSGTGNGVCNGNSCNGTGGSSGGVSGSGGVPDPVGTVTDSASPVGKSTKLYPELTDNRHGTDVFSDDGGAAPVSGLPSIPFHTWVNVRCWAPNNSGMSSINVFYLVETSPWKGKYAPANTFLNGDTSGSLDPKVPKC